MKVLETERLILRHQTPEDAPFILELLNDPDWIRFIGDRGVRTVEDARNFIVKNPMDMYARFGFGFYLTELKDGGVPIGICGLAKRDYLDDVDIGYAFLPDFRGKGYAYEASSAVKDYARSVLGLQFENMVTYADTDQKVRLFAINF